MNVITRWRIRRHPAPAREFYMTPAEHFEEAERLALVVDEEIQSDARRTLGDLIALARLHLDLACVAAPGSEVTGQSVTFPTDAQARITDLLTCRSDASEVPRAGEFRPAERP